MQLSRGRRLEEGGRHKIRPASTLRPAKGAPLTTGRPTNCIAPHLVLETNHELYPLSAFCGPEGIDLPPYRVIAAAELPEPYRRLLEHTRDMTSVLQDFHAQNIHIEKVDLVRETDHLLRRVVLLGEDGRPVEFGAIDIWLPYFADDAQRDILASHTPFGAILHRYEIGYTSSPTGFFEIESIGFIGEALRLESPARLYGRTNVLRSEHGQVMARVVEILPPTLEDR